MPTPLAEAQARDAAPLAYRFETRARNAPLWDRPTGEGVEDRRQRLMAERDAALDAGTGALPAGICHERGCSRLVHGRWCTTHGPRPEPQEQPMAKKAQFTDEEQPAPAVARIRRRSPEAPEVDPAKLSDDQLRGCARELLRRVERQAGALRQLLGDAA